MNTNISLIHATDINNLKKILQDKYLKPFFSDRGKGIYFILKKDNNIYKKRPIGTMFGRYIIEIDKNILLNRTDYSIYNAYKNGNLELFGGNLVYNGKTKNLKLLNKTIKNITILNEVKFINKISIKKYLKNIYYIDKKFNFIKLNKDYQ